jgi:hypothetical protein
VGQVLACGLCNPTPWPPCGKGSEQKDTRGSNESHQSASPLVWCHSLRGSASDSDKKRGGSAIPSQSTCPEKVPEKPPHSRAPARATHVGKDLLPVPCRIQPQPRGLHIGCGSGLKKLLVFVKDLWGPRWRPSELLREPDCPGEGGLHHTHLRIQSLSRRACQDTPKVRTGQNFSPRRHGPGTGGQGHS